MENVTNEFDEDVVYTIYETDANGNNPVEVVAETPLPVTNQGKTYLKTSISIAARPTIQYYKMVIEYKFVNGKDQIGNNGKLFRGTVGIDTELVGASSGTVCIRAETLHTDTCGYDYDMCGYAKHDVDCDGTDPECNYDEYYDSGYKSVFPNGKSYLEFGNLGTSGQLNPGDAYDCDVNGDGTYDSENERFYYITDLDSNSNYAVLLYSNNTYNGVPNTLDKSGYSLLGSGDISIDWETNECTNCSSINISPDAALAHLPSSAQWSNVSLSNETRDIKDYSGQTVVQGFSYYGKAARLLTLDEILSTYNNLEYMSYYSDQEDIVTNVGYLFEKTYFVDYSYPYGYWLETLNLTRGESSIDNLAYTLQLYNSVGDNSNYVGTNYSSESGYYGVRPAIEVLKADMEI